MSNFITGLFTLLAALGAIWLKDHLDQKKTAKSTRKQKAVEAYMLCGRLMHSLSMLHVICANLIDNKNYPYTEIWKDHPDTSSATLEKLELLIIENFYDLNLQLFAVEQAVNTYGRYLINIVANIHQEGFTVSRKEFDDSSSQYAAKLVESCHALRAGLIDKHISLIGHPNFHTYIKDLKQFKVNFLKK